MSRIPAFVLLLAAAFIVAPAAWAEDLQVAEEVKNLRALVEKQSKQLDTLAEQIARLRITLEKSGDIPLGAAAPVPQAPAAAAATPAAPPVPAPAEFSSDVPKAEPADGKRHVVIKGETLTSIAKHYNIPLLDLKKANKDVDERKLQIGQTLTIPAPKSVEAPPEKKETP